MYLVSLVEGGPYPKIVEPLRAVAGITKLFWVTIEGYLSYLLPKFED